MAWTESVDADVLALMSKPNLDPPGDPSVLVNDPTWGKVLTTWATYKANEGDQQPMFLIELDSCLVQDLPLSDYYSTFFGDSPMYPVNMPQAVKDSANEVIESRGDDSEVKRELKDHTRGQLLDYQGTFLQDLRGTMQEQAEYAGAEKLVAQNQALNVEEALAMLRNDENFK
jgi:hypothetical protein